MKRWITRVMSAVLALTVLITASSCSFGSSDDSNGTTEEQKTYVITTEGHTGKQTIYDALTWEDNSVCAVAYLGNTSNWKNGRDKLYGEVFTEVDKEIFNGLETYDAGGNDVYLIVPRFDRENINLYGTQVDSEGKAHITSLIFSGNEPFYLKCSTINGTSSAKIEVLVPKVLKRVLLPTRDPVDGTVRDADGFQDITPSGIYFEKPQTTVGEQ